MSYKSNVFNVMIVSPCDVDPYRHKVRDVVHEWNDLYSEYFGIALMPIGWESHTFPEMGAPPQAIINRQILEKCDLLVAIFWTRLGTPTAEYPSGAVEEIERHMAAGKPTMIYFCEATPENIIEGISQFEKVEEFRKKCESRGLLQYIHNLNEFENKFTKQLPRTIVKNFKSDFITHEVITSATNSNGLIKQISLEGNKAVATRELEEAMMTEPGTIVSSASVKVDAKQIQAVYRKHGFAALVSDVKLEADGTLQYVILEGRVSEIKIEGLEEVDESFVRDMISTRPNDYFEQRRFSKDLNRIYDTGRFSDVTYKITDEPTKGGFLILSITLKEK
jgi:hypothetical protein